MLFFYLPALAFNSGPWPLPQSLAMALNLFLFPSPGPKIVFVFLLCVWYYSIIRYVHDIICVAKDVQTNLLKTGMLDFGC